VKLFLLRKHRKLKYGSQRSVYLFRGNGTQGKIEKGNVLSTYYQTPEVVEITTKLNS
jgi:hypothetical protein